MYRFERAAYEKRMQWFVQARFGMFIHWGFMPFLPGGNGCAAMNGCRRRSICRSFGNLILLQ